SEGTPGATPVSIGFRATTDPWGVTWARARARQRVTYVFPTPVPVPKTTIRRTGTSGYLAPGLPERGRYAIDVLVLQTQGRRQPQPREALRYRRRSNGLDQDPELAQARGELQRPRARPREHRD